MNARILTRPVREFRSSTVGRRYGEKGFGGSILARGIVSLVMGAVLWH